MFAAGFHYCSSVRARTVIAIIDAAAQFGADRIECGAICELGQLFTIEAVVLPVYLRHHFLQRFHKKFSEKSSLPCFDLKCE